MFPGGKLDLYKSDAVGSKSASSQIFSRLESDSVRIPLGRGRGEVFLATPGRTKRKLKSVGAIDPKRFDLTLWLIIRTQLLNFLSSWKKRQRRSGEPQRARVCPPDYALLRSTQWPGMIKFQRLLAPHSHRELNWPIILSTAGNPGGRSHLWCICQRNGFDHNHRFKTFMISRSQMLSTARPGKWSICGHLGVL